jgi:hypothetical protein
LQGHGHTRKREYEAWSMITGNISPINDIIIAVCCELEIGNPILTMTMRS